MYAHQFYLQNSCSTKFLGFKLNNTFIFCVNNMSLCTVVSCGDPPTLSNAIVSPAPVSNLYAALATCLPGYWSAPYIFTQNWTCSSTGNWVPLSANCTGLNNFRRNRFTCTLYTRQFNKVSLHLISGFHLAYLFVLLCWQW